MLGATISDLRREGMLPAIGDTADLPPDAPVSVKAPVFPFNRFRTVDGVNVDTVLGPEMRSTGEVMGIDSTFGAAFAKAQAGAGTPLPTSGKVFVSVAGRDKAAMVFPVKRAARLGFEILATEGTAAILQRNGVAATVVRKHGDGPSSDGEQTIVGRILEGEVALIVNTPYGVGPRTDGWQVPGRGGIEERSAHHDCAGPDRRGSGDRGIARWRVGCSVPSGSCCPSRRDTAI
jgi:carbamoyl-phosphate synthase large subunit